MKNLLLFTDQSDTIFFMASLADASSRTHSTIEVSAPFMPAACLRVICNYLQFLEQARDLKKLDFKKERRICTLGSLFHSSSCNCASAA